MPTIDDAHGLAQRYASSESLRTGRPWRGFVEEFPAGWAVWAAPPSGVGAEVGSGARVVLDRQTGRVSQWPPWPTSVLAEEYVVAPSDGAAGVGPVWPLFERVARLEAPDGRVWWQRSSLADDASELHPILNAWLCAQPSIVRGAVRHAELIVLSRALSDADVPSIAGSTPRPAPSRACDTCLQAYVHFGLLPESALREPHAGTLTTDVPPLPGGQPFDPKRWAQIAFDLLAADIAPVEAARAAIERYPFARSTTRGPGRDHWVRPFQLGVTRSMTRLAPALAAFGELMGAVLFPLGVEERGDGLIVIDGHGQVFVLDQAGAWFCGPDIDTAVAALAEGHSPSRLGADGSFER